MRALLLVFALVSLSACGFTPLHGAPGAGAAFSDVALVIGDGRDENDRAAGFELRQHLAERMRGQAGADYVLEIEPRVRQIGLGLTGADRASRFDKQLTARWVLRRADTGDVVARGREVARATFSADRDPYRLLATSSAAQSRVARDVADTVLEAVALALAEPASP